MKVELSFQSSQYSLLSLPLAREELDKARGLLSEVELKKMSKQRQVEFLSGRYAALLVFEKLGHKLKSLERSSSGSPCWPAGFVASLSHCQKWIFCAASDSLQGLGVDIEPIIAAARIDKGILKKILTRDEYKRFSYLNESNDYDTQLLATLIFSAKETLYKAIHPLTGHFFGFHDVEFVELNATRIRFVASPRVIQHNQDLEFWIQYKYLHNHVLTWLELKNYPL